MSTGTISTFLGTFCTNLWCLSPKKINAKFHSSEFGGWNSTSFLSKLGLCSKRQLFSFPLMLTLIFILSISTNAQNIKGFVPVMVPTGGFDIDGNAYANTPTVGWGDWFYNPSFPGAGGGLFNTDGTVIDPTRTFFLKDNWIQGTDLTIFTGTNKIDHNPSTYTWGPGSSPNKNEIQNAGIHFTYGNPGIGGTASDLWCIFAGDRMVTNGSSYIDFEFLQKPIKMTGTTSGGFTTEGIHGGRTVGDILVTIEFVQGGGNASVVIRKWEAVGAGYQYVVYPNSAFTGFIFGTQNETVTTVPFDVYGSNTYQINQWAEGAINLTQVMGIGSDPCSSISTVFVRTRSSGSSSQSELKDFPGAPIQLDLDLIPDAPGATTGERCGPGEVSFTATGCTATGSVLKWYASAASTTPLYTGTTYNVSITETTSYWVSCTSATGCEGPRTQITRVVNTVPVLVLTPTNATCFGGAKSISAAVSGTPLDDLEINIDGGTFANVTASPVVFNNLTAANHVIIVRRKADINCLDSKNVTLTEPDALDLVLTPTNDTCIGAEAGAISAVVSGTPLADLEINIDGGTFANVTASPVVFSGLNGGNHTIILRRKSDNSCMISKIALVVEIPCIDVLCTYTQGFYGNSGGMACTPNAIFSTLQLIQQSINNMPGQVLYLGQGTNAAATGGSFTIPYANASKIIDWLPGTGSASVLAMDYNHVMIPPLKNGKINNSLLSQTIALALNLYMTDNPLGDFVLEGGKYLVTVKKSKTSSCDEPEIANCIDDPSAINSWWIPANVVDALPAPKNVWTLFQLAKDALGGKALPTGVKLSDIQSVVDKINNAFDGCRFFKYYSDVNEVCPVIEPLIAVEPVITAEARTIEAVNNTGFEVFPVPFDNTLTIRYKFDYVSDVTIELLDGFGNVKLSKTDTNCYYNKEITLYLNISIVKDQMYYVKLTTAKESVVKKIISSK